jgi:hypothetical protein
MTTNTVPGEEAITPMFQPVYKDEKLKIWKCNRQQVDISFAIHALAEQAELDKNLFTAQDCTQWVCTQVTSDFIAPGSSVGFLTEKNGKYYLLAFKCSNGHKLDLTPSIKEFKRGDCLAFPRPTPGSVWPQQQL